MILAECNSLHMRYEDLLTHRDENIAWRRIFLLINLINYGDDRTAARGAAIALGCEVTPQVVTNPNP